MEPWADAFDTLMLDHELQQPGSTRRTTLEVSMLTRLGWFSVKRRRFVVLATVLFMVVAGVFGTGAFGVLKSAGFDDPSSESFRASELLQERFAGGDPNVVLLLTTDGVDLDDESVADSGAQYAARLDAIDGIDQVTTYWSTDGNASLRSTDGDTALVLAQLSGNDEQMEERFAQINASLVGLQGPFDVLLGGSEAGFDDIGSTIEGDLGRAELIAIPLTLLLLLFVFRGVIAASLPVLVGVIAVLGTFLSLYVIGSVTDVSIYAINLTTALGLGLSIDYSLFIVSRFREELDHGRTVEDAVVRTVETAGKTVLVSALTVAASLSALLLFPLYFLRSFAYAGVAVVALALVASVVTLPSLLAMLGHRVNSLSIGRRRTKRSDHDGMWHRIATVVMRRPIPIAMSVVAVLLLLGAPFLDVRFGTPDDRVLSESAPSRQASEVLRNDFSGNSAESFGVVSAAAGSESLDEIGSTAATISELAGVDRVESAAGTFVGGVTVATDTTDARFVDDDASWMSVVPSFAQASTEGEDLVRQIRSLDAPIDVAVEGTAASLIDTKTAIADRLPVALGIIAITTFVLLFLLTGSLLVPLKALLLNLLSLTATFGAMVWIFQDGNLSGVLDFTATGTIDTSMPILMFCIAFGLSMDYEVFLISRIKEEYDRTGDNNAAVALGLERTGRIITAAAALLAITFFAFGTSGVSFIKMFGIGLGLAILMDATIVRALLVPAFMRLAGDANWWAPGPLRRFHHRYGLSHDDQTASDDDPDRHDTSDDQTRHELVGAP